MICIMNIWKFMKENLFYFFFFLGNFIIFYMDEVVFIENLVCNGGGLKGVNL